MALTIKMEDLTDVPGGVQMTRVDWLDGSLKISPEWRADKWSNNPANIFVEKFGRHNNLNSLFFVPDERDDLERIDGSNPHGNSFYSITDRKKIERLAANFGVPAADIDKIGYVKEGSNVGKIGIVFRDGIDAGLLKKHCNDLVIALENKGDLPRGMAFEMGERGHSDPGPVQANILGSNEQKLESFSFNGAQNKTGQHFEIRPTTSGGSEIIFGDNKMMSHGSVYRHVSREEFEAAQKIAAIISGRVAGEAGTTALGVKITTSRSALTVIDDLAKMGLVSPGVAEQARQYQGMISQPKAEAQKRRPMVPRRMG